MDHPTCAGNVQALHVQQRWIQLDSTLDPEATKRRMETMAAWCDGRLAGDAPSSRSFPAAGPLFKPVPLPTLAAVPISTLRKFPAALMSRAVNAMTFSRRPGDALSRHALQLIGEQLCSPQKVLITKGDVQRIEMRASSRPLASHGL